MESTCAAIARIASERLGVPTCFIGDISWQERELRFGRGEIDVLWICGLPYVWNWQTDPGAVSLLAAPVATGERYGGDAVYFSDVVVRRESGLRRFEDLRGKHFVYNEPRSHSGYNVVRHHLARLGEARGFFASARATGAHQASIEWVVDGRADASAIDSTVLEVAFARAPGLAEHLTIIDTLGPSPMPPWLVRGDLDPALRAGLRRLLLEMHEDPAGAAALAASRIERFVAVDDDHYDPIRRMAEAAERVRLD